MSKYSMNNIFEDKTFLMFERAGSATASPLDGKAYFVEEKTGRICIFYRFPYGGEKEFERVRGNGIVAFLIIIILIPLFFVGTILNLAFSDDASVVRNAILLFVANILLAPVGLLADKKQYKYRFEDFQRVKKNHYPVYIDDSKKGEVLARARRKGWNVLAVLVALLFGAIGAGYGFIMGADTELLLVSPSSIFLLLALAPDFKDRLSGWKFAWKIYWSKSVDQKEE
jgi:hypothetical protein